MYIELFLLDNLLMDLLILRLSAAMLSLKASFGRILIFALFGSAAAAAAAGGLSFLLALPGKLGLALVMSFALPGRSARSRAYSFAAVLLSAAIVGGAVLLIALIFGEDVRTGGIGLRTALWGSFGAALLPSAIRKLLSRRTPAGATVRLHIEFSSASGSKPIECAALIDTGSSLFEPVSGLPVIVLNRRRYADAAALARIPIPIRTASGAAVIYAIRPVKLLLDGSPVNALVAFSSAESALVPPAAMPAA